MDYIEALPNHIIVDGNDYFLRIKKRGSYKQWAIQYVGKIPPSERKLQYSFRTRVRGFTYKAVCQQYGHTLEQAAMKAYHHLANNPLVHIVN